MLGYSNVASRWFFGSNLFFRVLGAFDLLKSQGLARRGLFLREFDCAWRVIEIFKRVTKVVFKQTNPIQKMDELKMQEEGQPTGDQPATPTTQAPTEGGDATPGTPAPEQSA